MTTIQFRTDEKTKEAARKILKKLGLNLSSALNMFLIQVIRHNGLPFEVLTKDAMTQAKKRKW